MFWIGGPVDLLGLFRQIRLPDVSHREDRQKNPLRITKGQRFARADLSGQLPGDIQRDGDGPERTVGEAHPVPDPFVVGLVQETGEGAEASIHQELQIPHLAVRQVPRTANPGRPPATPRLGTPQPGVPSTPRHGGVSGALAWVRPLGPFTIQPSWIPDSAGGTIPFGGVSRVHHDGRQSRTRPWSTLEWFVTITATSTEEMSSSVRAPVLPRLDPSSSRRGTYGSW